MENFKLPEGKKANVLIFSIEDYNRFLIHATDDLFEIQHDGGEWFHVVTDECDDSDEAIYKMLGEALGETVTDIIVDITNQKVVVVLE